MNIFVEKVVEKMWMKNVYKNKMWNKLIYLNNSFTHDSGFTRVFQNNIDKFYTKISLISYLLNGSFTSFTHRTINTTITFNNKKKEINF